MDHNESQLYIGAVVGGRYEVLQFVGSGNFSGVFLGRDQQTGSDVAIKVLSLGHSGSPHAVFEFQEDGRLLKLLQARSNVVDILDDGTLSLSIPAGTPVPVAINLPYMVLEFSVGGSTSSCFDAIRSRGSTGSRSCAPPSKACIRCIANGSSTGTLRRTTFSFSTEAP